MAGRKNNYVTKEEFDAYTVKTDANFAKLFQLLEAPNKDSAPQNPLTEEEALAAKLPKQTKGKGNFDRACYDKTAKVLGCKGKNVGCYSFAREVVTAYAKGEADALATATAYLGLEKPSYMA